MPGPGTRALCAALVGAIALHGVSSGLAKAPDARPLSVNPSYASGFALYQMKCASCHGQRGDGRGAEARWLVPRPRDFTRGVYKLRSTPSGSLPRNEDLARTIAGGVHGTAMQSWSAELSPRELAQVIELLKSFSPRFEREGAGPIVKVPPAPKQTPALVVRGREVYAHAQCARCHGTFGRGDGPASVGLESDDGLPIRPHDFSMSGQIKSGSRAEDMYRAIATCLDGTPMHAADRLSPADRWAIVFFLMSLSNQPSPDLIPGGPGPRGSRERWTAGPVRRR